MKLINGNCMRHVFESSHIYQMETLAQKTRKKPQQEKSFLDQKLRKTIENRVYKRQCFDWLIISQLTSIFKEQIIT